MQYCHYKFLNKKPTRHKINGSPFTDVQCFQKPATSKGQKLYIVKCKDAVLYVGITSQSITNRLRYGFTATGKHGYHGYKWKDHKEELDLLIWYFPDKTDVEAIEAEVVFNIRKHTGLWPAFQTEIHFHKATQDEILIAEKVFKITTSDRC